LIFEFIIIVLFIDYYKMHHLPNETLCYIFKFVKDRIPVSRTCKKWNVVLDNMYKQKLLSDINDPYYFKKYLDEVGLLNIKNNIANINEHKCLNYISEKLYNTNVHIPIKFGYDLMIKNCQVNNVSKPKWLYCLYRNFVYAPSKIIDICLKYKAYDMLVILMFSGQLTITQIYKLIYTDNIFLRNTILAYLETKINPEILRLIKY
jgi:hypothetical protein